MTDAVRKALEAASVVVRNGFDWGGPASDWHDVTARAVATFLRSLPDLTALPTPGGGHIGLRRVRAHALAAAVEQAAKEAG